MPWSEFRDLTQGLLSAETRLQRHFAAKYDDKTEGGG